MSRSCLGLESLEKSNVSVSYRSWRYNVSVSVLWLWSCEHPYNASGLRIYQAENNGSDRKKQVVKWQTSPVSVLKLRHCGLDTFLERLISSRSWGFNVSVSSRSCEFEKMERLGLVSVLWLNVLWTSLLQSAVFRYFLRAACMHTNYTNVRRYKTTKLCWKGLTLLYPWTQHFWVIIF